jgi:adenylate kinase family enzyme
MNTINKRLDTFEKETMPVIKYFESIWKLITVWAEDSVDEIYKKMIDSLKAC